MKNFFIGIIVATGLATAFSYAESVHTSGGNSERYEIITSGDGGIAWRLDTQSGAMIFCLTGKGYLQNNAASPDYGKMITVSDPACYNPMAVK